MKKLAFFIAALASLTPSAVYADVTIRQNGGSGAGITITNSGSGGGGSGTPGGSTQEVQFNNSGSFDGNPGVRVHDASNSLLIGTQTSTSNRFIEDADGDLWVLVNSSYNPTSGLFTRINVDKAAWGIEMQGAGLFPGEVDSGWVVWRATGSTYGNRNISTTFGAVGGWELGYDVTSNRDLVVGGGAIEVDGFGTFPYGRVIHSSLSGRSLTGVGRNLYNDLASHDSNIYPEVFVGFSSDTFVVAHSTPQVASNLRNLLVVSTGTAPLVSIGQMAVNQIRWSDGTVQVSSGGIGFSSDISGSSCIDNPTLCVDPINNRVGIGTTTPQFPLTVGTVRDDIGVNGTIVAARAYTGSGNGHPIIDISTFEGDSGTSVASYDSRLKTIGSNNYGHMIGYQSGIIHASTGTIGIMYGFGSFSTNNGSTVTTSYGFYADDGAGTGAINNQVGVYVAPLARGLLTNYAIYTDGDTPSIIGGQIRGQSGTSGVKLLGTKTNDNASTGEYGEHIKSVISGGSAGASGTIFDATSVFLSSGDWDVAGILQFNRNGATFTSTDFEIGITTNPGASAVGLSVGDNYFYATGAVPTTFTSYPINIPSYRMSLLGSTTVYLKAIADVYTAGTPQYNCRLSARRAR